MEAVGFDVAKQPHAGSAPHQLTARERQIVQLVVDGLGNDEIAAETGTSSQTIKNQLTVIFSKLRVHTRVQLAVYAIRRGLAE